MSITQTVVPVDADRYTSLIFHIPADDPVKHLKTGDLDLVPTEPLFVEPFKENIRTADAAPWHGTLEYAPLKDRVYKNSEGSWEFYYVADGKSHTFWDCYVRSDIDRDTDRWMVQPSTWTSTYHTLLHFLQGQRVVVDVPDGKGKLISYRGRCWVSGYSADQNGQMKLTISYSLAPPENYGYE